MKKLVSSGYKVRLDVLRGYEEDFQDTFSMYENEGWLTYYGYQKDVRPFISNSNCFVLPS